MASCKAKVAETGGEGWVWGMWVVYVMDPFLLKSNVSVLSVT